MFRYILPLSLITPICIASNQQSLAPATAPVPELLGRWEDAPGLTTIELEVGPGAMFPTITAALTAAPLAGLGVVPVTINIQPGVYNEANGEVFPFVIPAHGITLEGTDLNGGEVIIERNQNNGTNAMVLMKSLGNESLPPSVVRGLGLKYRYMDASGTAASIRIEVANPGRTQSRVMPEIRDCRIGGDYSRGIEIFSQPKTIVEPVIERNEIISSDPEPWDGQVGILVDGWPYAASEMPPAAEIPLTSPYIRSNRVSNYKKNISIEGGDFHNRPRLWSNFIHDGGINLAMESCAPYVNSNTIAFGNVAGTRWIGIKEMLFLNNCIWNPGFIDVDVVGGSLPGGGSMVYFNFDEDSTLAAVPLSNQYLANFAYQQPQYPFNFDTSPQFISGDVFNARTLNRNLHIAANSPMIDMGGHEPAYPGAAPTSQVVGSGSNSRTVRTDCAYDFDFQSRIITNGHSHSCDLGADETDPFELVLAGAWGGAVPAMDRVGNLRHNPLTGTWETEIVVQSSVQGLFTMIFAGTGNMTQLALPNTPVLENGPVYQHLSGMNLLPGVLENEIGLDFYTSNCMFQVAAGTTGNPIHLALPAYNSIYAEAEIQLCAVTLVQVYPPTATDSGLRFVVSNRIDLELN